MKNFLEHLRYILILFNSISPFWLAPETAPENVNVEHLTHDSVLVTWDRLPEELSGYTVYVRHYKDEYDWHDDGELGRSINVSSSESHVVLNNVEGGRRYQVSVAAFTVDWGPRSDWETFMVGKYGFKLVVDTITQYFKTVLLW